MKDLFYIGKESSSVTGTAFTCNNINYNILNANLKSLYYNYKILCIISVNHIQLQKGWKPLLPGLAGHQMIKLK